MDKYVPTFEAKCAKCASQFDHPTFGDFTYGEIIFYTIDGKQKAWASAFATFPQRVKSMLDSSRPKDFWGILASFADPIMGQKLVAHLVCPNCTSDCIEYWSGKHIGVELVQEAMFLNSSQLDDLTLVLKFDESRNSI